MPRYVANSWEEFDGILQRIKQFNKDSLSPVLFRGHSNALWKLESTLERRNLSRYRIENYLRIILKVKADVELFSGLTWGTAEINEMFNLASEYDALSLRGRSVPGDAYWAYLRHYGFPSPLLDWSRSPYVAAYFAFANSGNQERAIYALAETPNNMKGGSSDESQIKRLHQISQTYRRHYSQQSEYTMCIKYDAGKGWSFVPYDEIETRRIVELENWHQANWSSFNANVQDVIFKITLPAKLRSEFLSRLDEFNLNAFSLFGSEESLMETLAIRELDPRAPPKLED